MQISDLFYSEPVKRCPYCGRERELRFFYRSRTSADGLQSYCKDCQRRYREKHPRKEYKQFKHDDKTLAIW